MRPSRKKTKRFLAAAFLIMAAAAALVLWSGAPQKWALETAGRDLLGQEIEVERLVLLPETRARRLRIGPPEAPLAVVDDLHLDWRLRPEDGRRIASVEAGRLSVFAAHHDGQWNFSPLLEVGAGDETPDAAPGQWLPKRIFIKQLNVKASGRDAESAVEGLGLAADLKAPDQFSLSLRGDAVRIHALLPERQDPIHTEAGEVRVELERTQGAWTAAPVRVFVPGAGRIAANASVRSLDKGLRVEMDVDQVQAQQPLAALIYAATGFGFESAEVQDAQVFATVTQTAIRDVYADGFAAFQKARIVHKDELWFEGDVAGEGRFENDGGSATIRFGKEADLEVVLDQLEPHPKGRLSFANWQRDALVRILPAAAAGAESFIPAVQTLSADFAFAGLPSDYEVEASLAAVVEGAQATADMALKGGDAAPVESASVALRLPPGSLHVQAAADDMDAFTWEASAKEVELGRWLTLLTPWAPPEALTPLRTTGELHGAWSDGSVSGKADIQMGGASELLPILQTDASAELAGAFAIQTDAGGVSGQGLKATWGEWASATIDEWRFEPEQGRFSGNGELELELDYAPLQTAGGPLAGTLHLGAASFAASADEIAADVRLAWTGLGAGPVLAPIDAVLELEAETLFLLHEGMLKTDEARVAWRGEPLGQLAEAKWADGAGTAKFIYDGSLQPFEDLRLIASADGGHMGGTGVISFGDTGFSLEGDLKASADAFVYDPDLAALGAASAEWKGRIGETFAGDGAFAAETATVVGLQLADVAGNVHAMGEGLILPDLRARLWGGATSGDVMIRLGGDSAGTAELKIEGLDLAAFTEEVNPPRVRAAGTAEGELAAAWQAGEATALRLHLISAEGFTLNRDLLMQLLLAQYVEEGAGKQMGEIVARTVGDEAQRPFDRAELTLELQEGRYRGPLVLESDRLNLTIDLRIDEEEVAALLELSQESGLESIEKIEVAE